MCIYCSILTLSHRCLMTYIIYTGWCLQKLYKIMPKNYHSYSMIEHNNYSTVAILCNNRLKSKHDIPVTDYCLCFHVWQTNIPNIGRLLNTTAVGLICSNQHCSSTMQSNLGDTCSFRSPAPHWTATVFYSVGRSNHWWYLWSFLSCGFFAYC